jgi:hypothetical protein
MLRTLRLGSTTPARTIVTVVIALLPLACATTHEEPPAPPPPPIDPAAFSGPARTPAPEVDLNADQDASNPWADSEAPSAAPPPPPDAAVVDAQVAIPKRKR